MKRKVLSLLLVFCMVCGLVPVRGAFMTREVEAESAIITTDDVVKILDGYVAEIKSDGKANHYWAKRLDSSKYVTPGTYLACVSTTIQCYSPNHNSGSKGVPGSCKSNSYPAALGLGTAYQCAGFALYLQHVIYGKKPSDKDGWTKFTKIDSNFEFHPGDLVRRNGHSYVIHRVDNDTLYVDEANLDHLCGIFLEGKRSVSTEIKTIRNTGGYVWRGPAVVCKHDFDAITGNCHCGAHDHRYDKEGRCPCGYVFYTDPNNYKELPYASVEPAAGETSFKMKIIPYEVGRDIVDVRINSGLNRWIHGGTTETPVEVSKNDNPKAVRKVTNHYGNTWYLVQATVGGKTYAGYVYEGKIQIQSTIAITGETYPKNEAVAGDGAKTIVHGTVTATGSLVSEVTAAVFERSSVETEALKGISAGRLYDLAQSKAKYTGHKTGINKTSFDLNAFDSVLSFRKLAGGKSYVYVITATDDRGVSTTNIHEFYLKTSSSAVVQYTVTLNTGENKNYPVNKGASFMLPSSSRPNEVFLGWSDTIDGSVKYTAGQAVTVNGNVTFYAVFEPIPAPQPPQLSSAARDIAAGDSVQISWSLVSAADKYSVTVKNTESGTVDTYDTTGTSYIVPFTEPGTYSVRVRSGNVTGVSGDSAGAVTVTVHPDVVVSFTDYNGQILSYQDHIPYGGTANTPPEPTREGYRFAGWSGSLANIREDTVLTAIYEPVPYKVTFYNEDGTVLSRQNVTYSGDTPGSAEEPTPQQKTNYTFIGWDTDAWKNVTKDGIEVRPVYLWSNANMPLTVSITNVQEIDGGCWVYYTVTNHIGSAAIGRVVISSKSAAGRFLSGTESGAFYIAAGDGQTYSGNMFLPLGQEAKEMLSFIEVYAVDSYQSTKPIAKPDSYIIGSTDGKYSVWMTEADLAKLDPNSYTSVETDTQYRYRTKSTYVTTDDYYLGWEREVTGTVPGEYGNWSAWQDRSVSATENREVETRRVEVSPAHTEYRYGRYYTYTPVYSKENNYNATASSPSIAHYTYYYPKYTSSFQLDYSSWSTTRYSPDRISQKNSLQNTDEPAHYYKYSDGYYYWYRYYLGSEKTGSNRYFWEESRVVPAEYKTQYRYRTRTVYPEYTYYKWSGWSDWSFAAPFVFDSTVEAETRTVYRVRLSADARTGTGGRYRLQGAIGEEAAGKEAILTVYKVGSASDYSNEYWKQVTLGAGGVYDISFDTLETPSVETGTFTAMLTVEGATTPLCIGSIEPADKPTFTVKFLDGVTGGLVEEQNVEFGAAAEAPEIPEHEGYFFLGWEYGLGNIREDMTIAARFIKRGYTVVFADNVNGTLSMQNDIPYGEKADEPEVEAPEGYVFIGWRAPEGLSTDAVTGHMIVTAEYERITHKVTFMSVPTSSAADGSAVSKMVTVQTVNHGEYAIDPIRYEWDTEENSDVELLSVENDWISEEDLHIPDNMYFVGWSSGISEPVKGDLILTPVVAYLEDTPEIVPELAGGMYIGPQTLILQTAGDSAKITVNYRLNTAEGEGEWTEYNLSEAQLIPVEETCVLEIEAYAENCNGFNASCEYIILSEADVPAAPTALTAVQADGEALEVSWKEVPEADGYMVYRLSDRGETSEFMTEGTAFRDETVDELRSYTYSTSSYVIAEKSGASLMLLSGQSEADPVVFFGDNTPVETVRISGVGKIFTGSSMQLTAKVTPEDAMNTSVTWSVENGTGEGYITSEGLFLAVSSGTVKVTAIANDGSGKSDTTTIVITQPATNSVELNVSSALLRGTGATSVSVSLSEDSRVECMQFAVLYDSTRLTLTAAEAGEVIAALSPTINAAEEGIVYFNWDAVTALNEGGSLLDLTFTAKEGATGDASVMIATDDSDNDFIFIDGSMEPIDIAVYNGVITVSSILLGDVNGDEKINIMDANLIRRHAAKLITLDEEYVLAADVNGDGKVNIIDANFIRRFAAKLISFFPAEEAV